MKKRDGAFLDIHFSPMFYRALYENVNMVELNITLSIPGPSLTLAAF